MQSTRSQSRSEQSATKRACRRDIPIALLAKRMEQRQCLDLQISLLMARIVSKRIE